MTDAQLFNRRRLLGAGGAAAAFAAAGLRFGAARANPLLAPAGQTPEIVDELTIDLSSEPKSLDPATTYEVEGWSIVHSVYDSLVQFGPDGELEMVLAESLTQTDPTTFEIKLRPGVTFHNGEALDAGSIAFSLAHIADPETASAIAGNFAPITEVKVIDPLTVQLLLSQPAPWLPAQIAAWLACLPPVYAAGSDFAQAPIGTGPYRFVEWIPGERVVLESNPEYTWGGAKGTPIARRVNFRFVPDAATRVADLLAGTAEIVRGVPVDQIEPVESAGASVLVTPPSGTTFIRIPTDEAPFSDVRVRQALNYAIDAPAIIESLLGGNGTPLANLFVPNGLGYDPELAPYPYDPDKARALLAEAGLPDGFETRLAFSSLERSDTVDAIASMLTEAGIKTTVERVEPATFNQQWKDASAAPLRYVSWRPMFDPYTLLSLVFSNAGFLSRHDNPAVQQLIDAAATETDPAVRAETYRQLGQVLRDEPGAIYLWSLTALYGLAAGAPAWSTRADDYIIPTFRG